MLVEVAGEQLGQFGVAVVCQIPIDLERGVLLVNVLEHASKLIKEGLAASQCLLVLNHRLREDVRAPILHGCLGDGHEVCERLDGGGAHPSLRNDDARCQKPMHRKLFGDHVPLPRGEFSHESDATSCHVFVGDNSIQHLTWSVLHPEQPGDRGKRILSKQLEAYLL